MNLTQQQATQGTAINPIAILAAILFFGDKAETVKLKLDDDSEEIEMTSRCVGIEQEEDSLVCVVALDKILHFMKTPYDFKLRIDDGHAIMSFERSDRKLPMYDAMGKKIIKESPVIEKLLERLK